MGKREVWVVEFKFSPTSPAEAVEFWRQESQALAHSNKLNAGSGGKHYVTKYVPETK